MYKVWMTICLIYLSGLSSRAQLLTTKSPEELFTLLARSKPDTNRIELLLQLSVYYYFERDNSRQMLDSATLFIQQAEDLSHTIQSNQWAPEMLCYLGKCRLKTGDARQANDYFAQISPAISSGRTVREQIERWRVLGWNIQELDTVGLTRIGCLEKIAALYHGLGDITSEIEQEKNIADTHMKQGNLDIAENELLAVLKRYKAIGFTDLHYVYNLLSVDNRLKGNYNKALSYSLQTIESMQKAKQPVIPAWAIIFYCTPAHLYDELGQPGKSIDYYRLVFASTPPDPFDFYMYREAGNFVRDLITVGQQKEALGFLVLFSKNHPPADDYSEACLDRTFAYYYNAVGNPGRANEYTRKMIGLEPSLGRDNEVRGDVEYDIGRYYLEGLQFRKAAVYFERALMEADLNNSVNNKREAEWMLFKADSAMGDYISAIKHLDVFRELKDSIFNVTQMRQIEAVQDQYEVAKKEQNIRLLEKESLLQQIELKQTRYARNWVLGAVALLLIITGLLIRNSQLKQRANQTLEIQKNDLFHLLKEKDWLVREIHHRVKNNLHMISGLLDAQAGFLKSPEAIQAIRESKQRVNAMSMVHQKLYQTANLSNTDMAAYINEFVSYLEASFNSGDRIHFRLQVERLHFDLTHTIPLCLILNEAITNAIKYAFPGDRQGEVIIQLKREAGQQFKLSIADDGIGLAPGFDEENSGSLGMSLMRGLSEDIGGTFSIESHRGTIVQVIFIYEAAA